MTENRQKAGIFRVIIIVAVTLIVGALVLFTSHKSRNTDVHVFFYSYSDVFPSTIRAYANQYFDSMGITYQNYDGSNNQMTQTEQVFSTLTRNPRVIAVNMVDSSSYNAVSHMIKAASEHGTYVIFFNREVQDDAIKDYDKAVYIGSKIEEAGVIQGEMIGKYLLKHYDEADLNHDGKISYVLFKGQEGNAEAEARTKYSVETANEILSEAGYPNLEFYDPNNQDKFLLDQNGTWAASVANEYMSSALIRYCDKSNNMIELVISNNDNMAEGAVSALQKTGYNTGKGSKYIPVFGVDATESAKVLIHNGCMEGTVLQDADKLGKTIAQISDNILHDRDMLYGLEDIPIDEDCRKLRIHYAEYTEN